MMDVPSVRSGMEAVAFLQPRLTPVHSFVLFLRSRLVNVSHFSWYNRAVKIVSSGMRLPESNLGFLTKLCELVASPIHSSVSLSELRIIILVKSCPKNAVTGCILQ